MRFNLLLPLSISLLLSGCVVPTGPVEVTRFNRVAEGVVYGKGSITILAPGDASTGLEASPYITAVTQELLRLGYNEKAESSDMIAEVRINSDTHQAAARSPVSVGVGGSTGSYGGGLGLGLSIDLSGQPKALVETKLSVRILRRSDAQVIWEGSAVQSARKGSPAAQPGIAAAKLASALFKDFPGVSGQTISVP